MNVLDHYCIDPLERLNKEEVMQLIEQKKYFVLHAPRQSGKTSSLLALAKYLNRQGKFQCLYVNMETVFTAGNNLREGIRNILFEIAARARDYLNNDFPESIVAKILEEKGPNLALNELLTLWSKNSLKSIVLLLDEIDALDGEILISVLSQLRAGYDKRPKFFPHSIALCGVEDIRYKKINTPNKENYSGGNIFNIEAKSLRLRNFNQAEVKQLLENYAREQNHEIAPEALERIWTLTRGQPWIVNALAYEICFEMIPRKQNINRIEVKEVAEAAENLIQRRESHLKNLADELQKPAVKRIITPIILGSEFPQNLSEENIRYLYDLGLVNLKNGQIEIANGIYNEVIPRALIYSTQILIRYDLSVFLNEDGSLHFSKMLIAFRKLYAKHFSVWQEHFYYKEAGHFLFLQAFLQRIIDGGGTIIRQYGLGRQYFTLIIQWLYAGQMQKIMLDMRILDSPLEEVTRPAKSTLFEAMKTAEIKTGHIIFFDQNPATEKNEKASSSKIRKEYFISIWHI